MADGPVTPDLSDVMRKLARMEKMLGELLMPTPAPQSTFTPRKTPDQRASEAVDQIVFNIGSLRDAVRDGGSLPRPHIISGLRYALSEIPEHVLTPVEQEAAE